MRVILLTLTFAGLICYCLWLAEKQRSYMGLRQHPPEVKKLHEEMIEEDMRGLDHLYDMDHTKPPREQGGWG